MSTTLGMALTVTGHWFPFIAPFLGWLGVFITGSDTSSNALFAGIQKHTATALGLNPTLTVAANTSGGVTAKMISPQSIAVATAATGLSGKEGTLFRFTVLHSLGLVTIIGVMTYVQAYYLPSMIPAAVAAGAAASAATGLSTSETVIVTASGLVALAIAIVAVRGRLDPPANSHSSIVE
jgi:lactate permease